MELYFGGAYNGKLSYVKEKYNIKEEEIHYCGLGEIDFSKKVISGLHIFIYNNVIKDRDSVEYIKENINNFKGKIIICDDISSGIVPLKREDRKWREDTGRALQYLTSESNIVVRVFCGLPQVLKNE